MYIITILKSLYLDFINHLSIIIVIFNKESPISNENTGSSNEEEKSSTYYVLLLLLVS